MANIVGEIKRKVYEMKIDDSAMFLKNFEFEFFPLICCFVRLCFNDTILESTFFVSFSSERCTKTILLFIIDVLYIIKVYQRML